MTAKWRPLVRSWQLRTGPRLGSGERWLTVPEPSASSARLMRALGTDPEQSRPTVLATMVAERRSVPDWPGVAPTGAVQRLLTQLLRRVANTRR